MTGQLLVWCSDCLPCSTSSILGLTLLHICHAVYLHAGEHGVCGACGTPCSHLGFTEVHLEHCQCSLFLLLDRLLMVAIFLVAGLRRAWGHDGRRWYTGRLPWMRFLSGALVWPSSCAPDWQLNSAWSLDQQVIQVKFLRNHSFRTTDMPRSLCLTESYSQRLYGFQALKQHRVRDLPSAPGGSEGELQRGHCDALAKRQCGGY